jgi:hypothetical protein
MPASLVLCFLVSSQFIACEGCDEAPQGARLQIPPVLCFPACGPVELFVIDDSLGCNISCDGSQRSMKIHKDVLGCISWDSASVCVYVCVCVCVCVCVHLCSPISFLGGCLELCHFDNLLFSICFIHPCMSQREIATCSVTPLVPLNLCLFLCWVQPHLPKVYVCVCVGLRDLPSFTTALTTFVTGFPRC